MPHNTWFGASRALPFGMMFWHNQSKVQVRGYYADINASYNQFASVSNNTAKFKVIACDGKIVFDVNGVCKILEDKENITDTYFGSLTVHIAFSDSEASMLIERSGQYVFEGIGGFLIAERNDKE
jgi:hypothetical protein